MKNLFFFAVQLTFFSFILGCGPTKSEHMSEISFDLGKNIQLVARNSGISDYSIQKVGTAQLYSLEALPVDVSLHYVRPSYELRLSPVFSISMYADSENNDGLAVESADIMFPSKLTGSHRSARLLVESIVNEFKKGAWHRYITSDCPAVTGRSALLDENGELDTSNSCAIDPSYRMSEEDWIASMRIGQRFKWIGDGVIAQLSVSYTESNNIQYAISLELSNAAIAQRRAQAKLSQQLEAGDKAGWGSTSEYKNALQARKDVIATLEKNALARGDKVLVRE